MQEDNILKRKQEVDDKFSKYVIPLFAHDDKQVPKMRGTCIVVHHKKEYYLVTAQHVISEERMPGGVYLLVADKKLMKVDGHQLHIINETEKDKPADLFDIVVIKLAKGFACPPYPAIIDKFAVEMDWLLPGFVPRAAWSYVMMGFPQSRNKNYYARNVISRYVHAYEGSSLERQEYKKLKFEEENFILIKFNKRGGFGDNTKDGKFPELKGMSGGPIFLSHSDPVEFKKIPVRIVAITTDELPKEKVVRGTDIGYAIHAIKTLGNK